MNNLASCSPFQFISAKLSTQSQTAPVSAADVINVQIIAPAPGPDIESAAAVGGGGGTAGEISAEVMAQL